MLVLEHTLPFLLLLLVVMLALGAGLYSLWRYLNIEPGTLALGGLYTLTLALLFWCLLLPGCRDIRRIVRKPRFVVMLDTSQSMLVQREDASDTRWERARQALDMPWTTAVAAEAEIDVFPFDTELGARIPLATVETLEAVGTSTRIRDSLRDLAGRFYGVDVAGLLLLTDGHDTREAFDGWASDGLPFPVYTVRLEDDLPWQQDVDVRVDAVVTPRRVVSGRTSEMRVSVSGAGTRGEPIAVQVFRDDVLVDEQPTTIPDEGGRRELTFRLEHPDVGVHPYRVAIPPLPGEKNVADNEYLLSISVQDPQNRLLYVEGVPRFEYRFLRRVLLAEEQVSPVVFYSTADGSPRAGSTTDGLTADMTEQELLQVKIVILGNLTADELGEHRVGNLLSFVETGGSLILLGGARGWGLNGFRATGLEVLLPVESLAGQALEGPEPFPSTLTAAGEAHPAFGGDADFWAVMPPVLSVFPGAVPRRGAEVLVEADTPSGPQAVVLTQRYGQGRVAAILTDSLWRWQLDPDTIHQPYARFWTQLISWLLPDLEDEEQNRLDLFADQDQIHIGESLELSVRVPDRLVVPGQTPELRITGPDERTVPYMMSPGQVVTPDGRSFGGYQLRYEPEAPGRYQAVAVYGQGPDAATSEQVLFQVRDYSPETAPRPIREDILQTIAQSSGGRHFSNLDELNRALLNFTAQVTEEQRSDFFTLWQRWPILILLMALAAGMWGLRKRLNMP